MNALEPLKQHRIDVPRNCLDREKPMCIPRFLMHFRNVNVAKIKNGMKPREIISGSQKLEDYRYAEKSGEHREIFPKRPFDLANAKPTKPVSTRLRPQKIKVKRQSDQ